jgi:hypothetical protein
MTMDYLMSDTFKTAGGTGVPTGISTGGSAEPTVGPDMAESNPIARWLRSEMAQRYQGLWVLLSAALEPQDSDLSPTALRDRNPDLSPGSEIAYVPATTVQLGV